LRRSNYLLIRRCEYAVRRNGYCSHSRLYFDWSLAIVFGWIAF
jgi:hypothetical protein